MRSRDTSSTNENRRSADGPIWYKYSSLVICCQQLHLGIQTVNISHNFLIVNQAKMGVKIGDYDLDTSNISAADVENLRKMLPPHLQQPGKLTQLEIILEAIHYIQMLQSKLKAKEA